MDKQFSTQCLIRPNVVPPSVGRSIGTCLSSTTSQFKMDALKTTWLFIILYFVIISSGASKAGTKKTSKRPKTDNKLRELLSFIGLDEVVFIHSKTKHHETQCDQDFTAWLNDLKRGEQWALEMFDVQAKPQTGIISGNRLNIGHYDGCLKIKSPHNFTGQYCLLSIAKTTESRPTTFSTFNYGICVPSSCSKNYVENYLKNLEFPVTEKNISQIFKIGITNGNCHKLEDSLPFTTINIITILVFIFIIIVSVTATIIELTQHNTGNKTLSSFFIINNAKILFSDKKSSERISSLTGFRAINGFLLILNHQMTSMITGNLANGVFVENFSHPNKLSLFFQATYHAADTILALSGAFIVIKFFKTLQNQKPFDPIKELLHRYLRFIVPISLLLLLRSGLSEHFNQGPVYHEFNEYHRKNCGSSIWPLMFCYENIGEPVIPSCFPHLWYISLDLQLFAVSQIILIAGVWKRKAVWVLALLFCLSTTLTEFLIGYFHNLAPSPKGLENDVNMIHDYAKPYTRGTPWFVGMLLGYVISCYQNYRPNNVTKSIMWVLTLLALSTVYFGINWLNIENHTQPSSALFLSGHRLLWAFGSCWIIYALYVEIAAPLEKFLSWGLFKFTGELSLEIYLVHLPIIQFVIATSRESIYYSVERSLYDFFPVTFFSTALAILMAVFVTIPCQQILRKIKINFLPISQKESKIE